jgi:uncharacterized protein YjbJ (UPF0337 family)
MTMKPWIWFSTGIGLSLAAFLILTSPGPQAATGSDDVERAARKAAGWGAKQRVSGAGTGVMGKLKEGLGNLTGNDELAGEGIGDQVAGGLKKAAGEVAQAAGQTLHDLNI